jgi:hypothetical protein
MHASARPATTPTDSHSMEYPTHSSTDAKPGSQSDLRSPAGGPPLLASLTLAARNSLN